MSPSEFTDDELIAWFDEMLPVERMVVLEQALRNSESFRNRAANLSRRRDHGAHSLGEIWRRERLSCPSRYELGSFLLGSLDGAAAGYLEFHIQTVGCRLCAANLHDLQQAIRTNEETGRRRKKFFQTSAGYLPGSGLSRS